MRKGLYSDVLVSRWNTHLLCCGINSRSTWLKTAVQPPRNMASGTAKTNAQAMSVAEATIQMKSLRHELRQMERSARTLRHTNVRVWYPNSEAKALAVLVWMLSGETTWAMVWIQQWQRLKMMHALALPGNITENMLHQWRTEYADTSVFQQALVRLDHPWRIRIDLFLVETLLYEEIINQNKKGLVVPANSIPAMFIKNGTCAQHQVQSGRFCKNCRQTRRDTKTCGADDSDIAGNCV